MITMTDGIPFASALLAEDTPSLPQFLLIASLVDEVEVEFITVMGHVVESYRYSDLKLLPMQHLCAFCTLNGVTI